MVLKTVEIDENGVLKTINTENDEEITEDEDSSKGGDLKAEPEDNLSPDFAAAGDLTSAEIADDEIVKVKCLTFRQ